MSEKIALVTGSYGGLGSELCKLIAAQRIRLVLVDRDLRKSQAFAAQLNAIWPGIVLGTFAVDLADHRDIRRVTADILHEYDSIDFLFNNAGVLTEQLQFSTHGNELHFEVNTLAPLQLMDQLRPALQAGAGAMVVNTSAGLSLRARTLAWDELVRPTRFRKLYGPYVASKQALNVLTAALGREWRTQGILVRAADPGPNQTRLTRGAGTPLWMRLLYALLPAPAHGAQKIFSAAASEAFEHASGIFITGGKVAALPPTLADHGLQAELLSKCRIQAAA